MGSSTQRSSGRELAGRCLNTPISSHRSGGLLALLFLGLVGEGDSIPAVSRLRGLAGGLRLLLLRLLRVGLHEGVRGRVQGVELLALGQPPSLDLEFL